MLFNYPFVGRYKVEMFDRNTNSYVATYAYGLGMHVTVRDPDESIIMSRVSHGSELQGSMMSKSRSGGMLYVK